MMLRALLILLALLPQAALAQTCPAVGSHPALTAGGSVFGRIAAQWNTYFSAKVDINNGVLCNPTIIGGVSPGSFIAAPGLANQVGARNTGDQTVSRIGGTLYDQLWPVPKSASYVVNSDSGTISDHGALLIASAAAITFTLPDPVIGSVGVSYQFGSDGTNGYTLATVGGTALIYGCQGATGAATAVFPANVDVQVSVDAAGTGYKCSASGGGVVSSVTNADGSLTVSPTTGAVVASLNVAHANLWTALQTFADVTGSIGNAGAVVSGTTYTFVAGDCGKTVVFTSSSAVTATIPAAIVPATTVCAMVVLQAGTAKVSVNGTAVAAATLISESTFTGTSGTAGSMIGLTLLTVSAATRAYLTGSGS